MKPMHVCYSPAGSNADNRGVIKLMLSTVAPSVLMRSPRWSIILLVCCLCTAWEPAHAESEQSEPDSLEQFRGQIVKQISIHGNQITKEYVVAREIWTAEGNPLDPELVREDIVRLQNLSVFGSVEVKPIAAEGGVELDYQFTEMPWLIAYPAGKYTEENGFAFGAGIASPNLAGRDITLSASALFGGMNIYRFEVTNPWITGNHVSAMVRAWHLERDNVLLNFIQTDDLIGVNTGTYIGQDGRFEMGAAYYAVTSDRDSVTLDPDNTDHMWTLFGTVGYDSRDSWRVAHDGWRALFSPLFLGGVAHTWTLQFDIRRYQPVAKRHTIAMGPLLAMQSGTVGVEIPSYRQYFLGGANTIRGFKLEDLGQDNFGKNQFLYTLEYRYLLSPLKAYKIIKWNVTLGLELAAFGDVGIAWSTSEEFSWDRTRFGYGAGLRFLVPSVGMVRFDMGISQYGDVVLNFGVGSIFDARAKRVR